ncbi:MAG: S8 family serine peptidase [Nitrospirota bacterium]
MQKAFFAVLFSVLAILSYVPAAGASENPFQADEKFKLKLLKATIDTRVAAMLPESAESVSPAGHNNFYILQFDGPVQEDWLNNLKAMGVQFYSYIPENAYIVKMSPELHSAVLFKPHVQYVGEYRPEYKTPASLDARIARVMSTMSVLNVAPPVTLHVKLFDREPITPVINRLKKMGAIEQQEIIKGRTVHYKVKILQNGNGLNQKLLEVVLPASSVPEVAKIPRVEWVEEYKGVTFCNNMTKPIVGAAAAQSIQGRPLDGNGQILGILDSGLDNGMSGIGMNQPAFETLKNGHYKVAGGIGYRGDNNWSDEYGHGTFVAGIMTGYVPPSSLSFGNWSSYGGVAPQASLFVQSGECYSEYMLTPPMSTVFKDAYSKGVRIHNDSWGEAYFNDIPGSTAPVLGQYTLTAQAVDTFVWSNQAFLPVFAAGNLGSDHVANYPGYGIYSTTVSEGRPDGIVDLGSISPPSTAKNCLTVGATESSRPSGINYGATFSDNAWMRFQNSPSSTPGNISPIVGYPYSGGIENVAAFSSRGPTADGRVKPDLVAPGTMISSTLTHLPDYVGDFQDPSDVDGGTSYAAPLVSGAAGLVEQYYHDFYGINPSAALVKATLINGAVDIGTPRTVPDLQPSLLPMMRPDFHQGWGRLDIMRALYPGQTDGAALPSPANPNPPDSILVFKDVTPGFKTGPFAGADYCFSLKNTFGTVRVTLVWTDYPGTPAAATELVNQLELTVIDPDHNVHTSLENNFLVIDQDHPPYVDPNAPADVVYDPKNNVHSIEFSSFGGDFIVQVHAANIPMGPQPYALVITGPLDAQVSQPDTAQASPAYFSHSKIIGKAVLQSGAAAVGYTVTASGPTIMRATTDTNGNFTISNVQGAKYFLNAYLGEPTPGDLKSVAPNVLYTATPSLTPASVTLTVGP